MDADDDGYAVEACGELPGGDCDDANATVFPGAEERCDDVDRDCDGYSGKEDADGDSFAACGDCDDSNAYVHPEAQEICNDADDDCNGLVDDDPVDGDAYLVDGDSDGFGSTVTVRACQEPTGTPDEGGDCDDANSAINPAATEVCDALDNDCDGVVDEGEGFWFIDADDDGYGTGEGIESCDPIDGRAPYDGDCNDDDDAIFPSADEYCNEVDDDCDGQTDEAGAVDVLTWYLDGDNDGYGQSTVTTQGCTLPSGFSGEGGDCDDQVALVYPGSHTLEVPFDGIDTDCDGNDFCTDLDCDAWPDIVVTSTYDDSFELESSIYWGGATGYSSTDVTDLPTYGAFSVESADLDQNGYPDLVFSGFGFDATSSDASIVYYNSATGFTTSEFLASNGATDVCIEDLDQNGWDDVVLVGWVDDNDHKTRSYVHYNGPNGFYDSDELGHRGSYHCLLEDVDADGYTDLIIGELTREANPSSAWTDEQRVRLYWGDGQSYGDDVQDFVATGPRKGLVEDLDGDSAPDLVFAEFYNGIDYNIDSTIWYGFSSTNTTSLPTRGAMDVVAEDFDGDGWMDLAFANLESDTGYAPDSFVYWGSSAGYGTANRTSLPTNGAAWVTADDLDGDTYPDLVFSNLFNGSTYAVNSMVYWGSSSGYTTGNRTDLPTEGAYRHTVHDLDADGYPELIFGGLYGASGGNHSTIEIFWGGANGYDASDVTELPALANTGEPLVVGP